MAVDFAYFYCDKTSLIWPNFFGMATMCNYSNITISFFRVPLIPLLFQFWCVSSVNQSALLHTLIWKNYCCLGIHVLLAANSTTSSYLPNVPCLIWLIHHVQHSDNKESTAVSGRARRCTPIFLVLLWEVKGLMTEAHKTPFPFSCR